MNPADGMFPMFPPPPPFHHAFPMQPPPYFHHAPPSPVPVRPPSAVPVRSVWASNFNVESAKLRHSARRAQYVAVDVHYPGVVHRAGQDPNALTAEQRYALVKANVDDLTPLQVGVALYDSHGGYAAWEFNLSDFRPLADPHDENSLAYLAGRGLDVDALRDHGVSADMLSVKLLESGLICPRRGRSRNWITYAGAYHVGYLLKIVTGGAALPEDVAGFNGAVRRYLGDQVYDVARMAADCPAMPLGLERVAAHLGFHPPLGSPRLAAAAGVRALQVFMRLKYGEFGGDVQRYRGLLEGPRAATRLLSPPLPSPHPPAQPRSLPPPRPSPARPDRLLSPAQPRPPPARPALHRLPLARPACSPRPPPPPPRSPRQRHYSLSVSPQTQPHAQPPNEPPLAPLACPRLAPSRGPRRRCSYGPRLQGSRWLAVTPVPVCRVAGFGPSRFSSANGIQAWRAVAISLS